MLEKTTGTSVQPSGPAHHSKALTTTKQLRNALELKPLITHISATDGQQVGVATDDDSERKRTGWRRSQARQCAAVRAD